jgi:AmmeMemoRadiSam system protein B/AmmeMemoRadiSam system protein A
VSVVQTTYHHRFYPGDRRELAVTVDRFIDGAPVFQPSVPVYGVIAPHAGYMFSGEIAGRSYRFLRDAGLNNPVVFLLGQSHNFALETPAVLDETSYVTPLGSVPVERPAIAALLATRRFGANTRAHTVEHSLEVQLPFLQRVYGESFSIVPVLVGDMDAATARRIAADLDGVMRAVSDRPAVFVCSTDLSHYPSYEDAVPVDRTALALVERMDPDAYFAELPSLESRRVPELHCVLCGRAAVGIALYLAQARGARRAVVLGYRNSGDTPHGERDRVVGYGAVGFDAGDPKRTATQAGVPESQPQQNGGTPLSEQQKRTVLAIAREAIVAQVRRAKPPRFKIKDPVLLEPAAVFVTLTLKGRLRGCIGTTFPREPLYRAVERMAVEAATGDPRFPPVREHELDSLHIEVSVLSPMRRVFSPDDIREHVHGVVVRRNGNTGLFLPQVWEQLPDKESFMGELCSQKAGLSPDAWKDPRTELYVFTVTSFEE